MRRSSPRPTAFGMIGDAAFEIVEVPVQLFEREGERKDAFHRFDRQVAYQVLMAQPGHLCGIVVEGRIDGVARRRRLAPDERHATGAQVIRPLPR